MTDYATEAANQRICSDLVAREVVCNLCQTIDFYSQHADDFLEAFASYDYEAAAEAAGWSEAENGYRNEDGSENEDASSWEELCAEEGIDFYDHHREVYEFWAVSSFLAEKLRGQGEIVADILDFQVWGRTCTGQAISLDCVIRAIASDMEILSGQRYSWSK